MLWVADSAFRYILAEICLDWSFISRREMEFLFRWYGFWEPRTYHIIFCSESGNTVWEGLGENLQVKMTVSNIRGTWLEYYIRKGFPVEVNWLIGGNQKKGLGEGRAEEYMWTGRENSVLQELNGSRYCWGRGREQETRVKLVVRSGQGPAPMGFQGHLKRIWSLIFRKMGRHQMMFKKGT